MWQPNDNDSLSSHQENEEKHITSSSQEDESNENWLLDFQRYYVDDYVADQEGRLKYEKDILIFKLISIHFNFQESLPIPNIRISQTLHLYNPQQFESTLRHYYKRSNIFHSVKDHIKYKNLQGEIDKRKTSQFNIDQRIDELSQYLTFTFKSSEWQQIYITYTNLNRSILPLAINYLQSILLVFKTWSYRESDKNEMDELLEKVSKQYNETLPYKPFQNHYINGLLYTQPESPIIMLRINLKVEFKPLKHSLNKTLRIRNIDQFKTILRSYDSDTLQDFVPLKSSSESEDIDPNITYHNTLQLRMDKVSRQLYNLFRFSIKEDQYDPLTLNLHYYHWTKSFLLFIIRHLELLTLTFKNWNNDENDRNAVDMYLSKVKDELLPLIKDKLWKSSWAYHHVIINSKGFKSIGINTFQLNLHIILRQYQRTITKTLQLEEPEQFIRLLNLYNYLSNGYFPYSCFPSSNFFDKSLYNLLYIFEQDENNPFTLNLYYYPFCDKLDTSLIIRHLIFIIHSLKNFSNRSNDTFEMYQYLSSIAVEFNSLSNPKLSLPRLHLPKPSPFDPSLFNPSLTKTSTISIQSPSLPSIPSTQSLSLPSNPFWYPYKPTDPTTVLPSLLTLHLRLLPFNNLTLKDNLYFQDTSRWLSILDHYYLTPNTFNHPGSNDFKVSNMIKIQNDTDAILLDLSNRILFSYDKLSNNPNLHLTYSNLKSRDIPSALLHLELMVKVFKTWSYDRQGGKVLNGFVGKARSTIIPNIPYDDDKVTGSITTTLPINRDHPQVLGSLVPIDPSGPAEVRASDGNLGGTPANFPNLLDIAGEDISMMGDVD